MNSFAGKVLPWLGLASLGGGGLRKAEGAATWFTETIQLELDGQALLYNVPWEKVSSMTIAGQSLKPWQAKAFKKRQGDTWLTCLKFLIPFYPLYYAISRGTFTPWLTGLILSIPVAFICALSEAKSGVDTNAEGRYPIANIAAFLLSPVSMGVGAMKAKRYAKRRLLQSDIEETE